MQWKNRVDSSVVQPAWKTSSVGSEAPNIESEVPMRRPKEKISWRTVREVPMKHRRLRTINRVDGLFLFSSCVFLRCFIVTCLLLPLTIRLATQYIKPSCALVCQRGYIDSVYQDPKATRRDWVFGTVQDIQISSSLLTKVTQEDEIGFEQLEHLISSSPYESSLGIQQVRCLTRSDWISRIQ